MDEHTNDGFGYGNAHRRHDAGALKHRAEILEAEHPRPPVDSSAHGVLPVIEGIYQHVPDRVDRQKAYDQHAEIIEYIEEGFAFGSAFKHGLFVSLLAGLARIVMCRSVFGHLVRDQQQDNRNDGLEQ